ncbi:MAG: HIT domain-containing protein [bacterium]
MSCVFCENPEIQKQIVVENELAFAFPTNLPITPGHLLVSPKRHVEYYGELTSYEQLAIEDLRNKLQTALEKVFDAKGFNFAWNHGEMGGQAVPHFHLHVVPRTEGDAGIHRYDPRVFLYRPGSRAKSPDEELVEIAGTIKAAL